MLQHRSFDNSPEHRPDGTFYHHHSTSSRQQYSGLLQQPHTFACHYCQANNPSLARPIIMTGSASAAAVDHSHNSRRVRKGRRETVRAACNFCCARKIKCDAARPHCSACLSRGRTCVYDTRDDGETRGAAIKRRCEDLERQLAALSLTRCDTCQQQADHHAHHLMHQHNSAASAAAAAAYPTPLGGVILPTSPLDADTPTMYEASVAPHASEILSALLNSTDEVSTGILAALRIGMPWRDADPTNNTSSLFMSYMRPWSETPASGSSARMGRNTVLDGNERAKITSVQGIDAKFVFDRREWIEEMVKYTSSTSTDAEHIQVVSSTRASDHSDNHHFNSKNDLRGPLYAVATMIDVGDTKCPFVKAYLELSAEIDTGTDVRTILGAHAHVSALSSDELYRKAPRLSQIIASMVKSIKLDGDEGHVPSTRCALMWLHWLLWRWLLDTSPASFQALPVMLRPTPWQLTVPHPLVYEFLFLPELRDYLCQHRVLDCEWITPAYASVNCDNPPEDFYAVHPVTGALDLSDAAKAHVSRPESWSFGSSVKPLLHNFNK